MVAEPCEVVVMVEVYCHERLGIARALKPTGKQSKPNPSTPKAPRTLLEDISGRVREGYETWRLV